MSIARMIELSAISETAFEEVTNRALSMATKTLRGPAGRMGEDQNALIQHGKITSYKVNVEITFELEDGS